MRPPAAAGSKEQEFEQVFRDHFRPLHIYAFSFVGDRDQAEDIVQSVFVKLWEKRDKLEITRSLTAYLYKSVYHECLNHLKHLKVREAHRMSAGRRQHTQGGDASGGLITRELTERIADALAELPEGCRTVFELSRYESLRYREIADRLHISVKTVENQMGKAIRLLRTKLAEYLPALLVLLWTLGL